MRRSPIDSGTTGASAPSAPKAEVRTQDIKGGAGFILPYQGSNLTVTVRHTAQMWGSIKQNYKGQTQHVTKDKFDTFFRKSLESSLASLTRDEIPNSFTEFISANDFGDPIIMAIDSQKPTNDERLKTLREQLKISMLYLAFDPRSRSVLAFAFFRANGTMVPDVIQTIREEPIQQKPKEETVKDPVAELIWVEGNLGDRGKAMLSQDVVILRGLKGEMYIGVGDAGSIKDWKGPTVKNNPSVISLEKIFRSLPYGRYINQKGKYIFSRNAALVIQKGATFNAVLEALQLLRSRKEPIGGTSVKDGNLIASLTLGQSIITRVALNFEDSGSTTVQNNADPYVNQTRHLVEQMVNQQLVKESGSPRVVYFINSVPKAEAKGGKKTKIVELPADAPFKIGLLRYALENNEQRKRFRGNSDDIRRKFEEISRSGTAVAEKKQGPWGKHWAIEVGAGGRASYRVFLRPLGENQLVIVGIFHKDKLEKGEVGDKHVRQINKLSPEELEAQTVPFTDERTETFLRENIGIQQPRRAKVRNKQIAAEILDVSIESIVALDEVGAKHTGNNEWLLQQLSEGKVVLAYHGSHKKVKKILDRPFGREKFGNPPNEYDENFIRDLYRTSPLDGAFEYTRFAEKKINFPSRLRSVFVTHKHDAKLYGQPYLVALRIKKIPPKGIWPIRWVNGLYDNRGLRASLPKTLEDFIKLDPYNFEKQFFSFYWNSDGGNFHGAEILVDPRYVEVIVIGEDEKEKTSVEQGFIEAISLGDSLENIKETFDHIRDYSKPAAYIPEDWFSAKEAFEKYGNDLSKLYELAISHILNSRLEFIQSDVGRDPTEILKEFIKDFRELLKEVSQDEELKTYLNKEFIGQMANNLLSRIEKLENTFANSRAEVRRIPLAGGTFGPFMRTVTAGSVLNDLGRYENNVGRASREVWMPQAEIDRQDFGLALGENLGATVIGVVLDLSNRDLLVAIDDNDMFGVGPISERLGPFAEYVNPGDLQILMRAAMARAMVEDLLIETPTAVPAIPDDILAEGRRLLGLADREAVFQQAYRQMGKSLSFQERRSLILDWIFLRNPSAETLKLVKEAVNRGGMFVPFLSGQENAIRSVLDVPGVRSIGYTESRPFSMKARGLVNPIIILSKGMAVNKESLRKEMRNVVYVSEAVSQQFRLAAHDLVPMVEFVLLDESLYRQLEKEGHELTPNVIVFFFQIAHEIAMTEAGKQALARAA